MKLSIALSMFYIEISAMTGENKLFDLRKLALAQTKNVNYKMYVACVHKAPS